MQEHLHFIYKYDTWKLIINSDGLYFPHFHKRTIYFLHSDPNVYESKQRVKIFACMLIARMPSP